MPKTIDSINTKIAAGKARIVRADEMTRIVRERGARRAAEDVDVVTTGTFGAMCSSGVWLNFGHTDPPLRMSRVWLNDVEAYAGVAAVDAYLGVTQPSTTVGIGYGGAHVIEDLLRGRPVVLRAVSRGTDCYPRKRILTEVRLEDLNFALLANPRNGYQRYDAATNSGNETLQTYMGKLLPRFGNLTYSGAGELSPLSNDPGYRTAGVGTRIFLGGAEGWITGPGTQHNPEDGFGTLMVQGDLKSMSTDYLRAAYVPGYGPTLYIGLGMPIPVLDEEIAASAGVADADICVAVKDYSVRSRKRPVLKTVSYADLKAGLIDLNGRSVRTAPLSSFQKAKDIAETLKRWILDRKFELTQPAAPLPRRARVRPLEIRKPTNGAFQQRHGGDGSDISTYGKTQGSKGAGIEGKSVAAAATRRQRGNGRRNKAAPSLWNEALCFQCGACLAICPSNVFRRDAGWRIEADASRCSGCGRCDGACSAGAIRLNGGAP